jgi:hypothetical protein
MNERDVGQKIARQLNYGLTRIRPETAERLRLARERALGVHHEPAVEQTRGLVFAGGRGHGPLGHGFHASNKLVGGVVLAVILAAAGAVYWYNAAQEQEVFDVDAVLLAEDLPINAYLNKDFQEWLEHSPEQSPSPSS